MLIRLFWVFPHGGIEDVWSGRLNPKNNIARVVNRRLEADELPRRGSIAADEELWQLTFDGRTVRFAGGDLHGEIVGTVWRQEHELLEIEIPAM